jgi:1-acyl-sn-glycerol-3-phosphate acyltransferase
MKKEIKKEKTYPTDHQSLFKLYPVPRGIVGALGYFGGMLLSRLLIRLSSKGTENIPKDPPYIVSPNHVTYVDGMWAASYLPKGHFKVLCSMAAKELEDSHGPFGKLIMRVGRGIASDRFGNPVRSLILAKKQLDEGQILLLHPEGTRSPDGELGEFKDGAAYLAFKSECPILPVCIYGGYEVFNRHMKWPQPFKKPFKRKSVTIIYGKPLLPKDYDSPADMTKSLYSVIAEMKSGKGQ